MSVKRRFIAGAKCPRCGKTDVIRSCLSTEREWMECVECGYEEERPTEVTPVEEHKDEGTGVVVFRGK
jgi:uncharacterized metal-binding protein (TIGR02443 family)